MMDTVVDIEVGIASFRQLIEQIILLPKPLCPTYFTVGERVRNKEKSRIEDMARFSTFVDDHIARVSGFDLIGEHIRFSVFVGATRNSRHQSSHVGCSIILRGRRWKAADYIMLLKQLCLVAGAERADACRRAEWTSRHVCVKTLPQFSIERTLGVDMSAFIPGLYWWTVFSDALVARHSLDVAELARFAHHYERWQTVAGEGLHAFRLYESPDEWEKERVRVSAFLESHPNFFSMDRIAGLIEAAETKEEFDVVTRPYWAGAVPWEHVPEHRVGNRLQ